MKDKRKPGRVLSSSQKRRNKKYGVVRAKVEHVFRVIKCQFGYRKVRYRGLFKNTAQMFSMMALAVTSREVVRLFLEQLRFDFVPVFHYLQGRFAA